MSAGTGSEPEVLPLRRLNRATLARQMLLGREAVDAGTAIERLVSLQAQLAKPPHVGLWTRIEDFRREELTELVRDRRVVRATMMRHTLHLVSARDYLRHRTAVQPAITRAFTSIAGKRLDGVDIDRLVAAARAQLADGPRTFAQLRDVLSALEPDREPSILGYAVRTHVPLIQVPSDGDWGFGAQPAYTVAEAWLGEPLAGPDDPRELVRRYLAAFGPAGARDVQTWSGLPGLKDLLEEMRSELRAFRDESGAELFDLPGAPLPVEDTPAPVRFLPEYDNLLLAHHDRRRVIADEHRPRVSLPGARVRATVLVDGFVRGVWKLEKSKGRATVAIEPFGALAKPDRAALAEEGEHLARFLEPRAKSVAVLFA